MCASVVIVCILIFALNDVAQATTIVVARTNNQILIGADSKVTDSYGNELSQVCKIHQVGNLFIALEGFWRDRSSGFSVLEIAEKALQLKPEAAAAERVSVLTGFLTTQLFAEIDHLRQTQADEYRKKFEGQTFLRVIVAGFEGKQPLLFVRQFRAAQLHRSTGITVLVDDCLADCRGEVVTRFLGETEAIDGLPEETPDFWKDGLATGVRRLLEIETHARSEYVGGPIDILEITARGAKWIQRKAACSPLRPIRKGIRPNSRGRQ